MKFSSSVLLALAAGFVAAQEQSSTTSSAPVPSRTPTASELCLGRCPTGDVFCQADCLGNPRPNEDQVNRTTQCAARCVQGNGTLEETARYAACQQDCIRREFFPAGTTGQPQPSGGNPSQAGTTGTRTPTGSGAAPTTTPAGSGAGKTIASGMGMLAFVAAALAL